MSTRLLWFFLGLSAVQLAAAGPDLNREIVLTPVVGDTAEDHEIARWQARAGGGQATVADFERLGWAYVAKARRTLDAGFFELALRTADVMDAQFGGADSAALLRGHALHNLHRFADAERVARQLVTQRGLADDYALLSDALMEQGKLAEAVSALQRAADMKPGAEVDTRIAHVRWLKGDLAGAVRAMEQAVRETSPADDEHIAWMLVQLSNFELQRGNVRRAAVLANAAKQHAADFPPALLAEGKIALATGDVAAALATLKRAAELNPLPEYQWWLADALRASGEAAQAEQVEGKLTAAGPSVDPRTTALFLATAKLRVDSAVEMARQELSLRADVQTHDALAWALYAAGNFTAAETESRFARAEGTRDPRLLLHAALIDAMNGDMRGARLALENCAPSGLLPTERSLYAAAAKRLAAGPLAAADREHARGLPDESAASTRPVVLCRP